MASNIIDGSMTALTMENINHTNDIHDWFNTFTSLLYKNAMSQYGYAKAFDTTNIDEVVSIKSEDTDLFGISQKVSTVSHNAMKRLLTYIDTTDNGNRVKNFDKMVRDCKEEQRIVVSILCNIKKLTDNQVSSPSNSFIKMDYFKRDDCSCC